MIKNAYENFGSVGIVLNLDDINVNAFALKNQIFDKKSTQALQTKDFKIPCLKRFG